MSKLLSFRTACWAATLLTVAGCSSPKQAMYEHESFDDSGTFSRNYPVTDAVGSCEAARRALLSQGYIITSNDPKAISGHKSFQQTGETHMEISFSVVCASDSSNPKGATMFANALQDRYALKKLNNSASVGVGVLGSLSMPIGSTDDSMVKVASETVSSAKFYDRFFALVDNFLPPEVKKAANIPEKPKADLGEPEPAAHVAKPEAAAEAKPAPVAPEVAVAAAAAAKAAAPAVAPAATPAATPVAAPAATPAAETSQAVAAPAEPAAIKVEPVTPAVVAAPVTAPVAAPAATPATPAPAQPVPAAEPAPTAPAVTTTTP